MKKSVIIDVSPIASPDKVVTYIPILTSFVYILFLIGTVVHHREIYLSALTLMFHIFFAWLYAFSVNIDTMFTPIRTSTMSGKTLQTRPLATMILLWLIHGSLMRSSEILVDSEFALYAGAVQLIVVTTALIDKCTSRLAYTIVMIAVSFTVFVIPTHDSNAFHLTPDRIYFRVFLTYILYWMFSIESMVNLNTCIASTKHNAGSEVATAIDAQQWHYVLRDVLRSIWPLFITEPGLVVGVFAVVVYASIRSATRLPLFIAYCSGISMVVRVGTDTGVDTITNTNSGTKYTPETEYSTGDASRNEAFLESVVVHAHTRSNGGSESNRRASPDYTGTVSRSEHCQHKNTSSSSSPSLPSSQAIPVTSAAITMSTYPNPHESIPVPLTTTLSTGSLSVQPTYTDIIGASTVADRSATAFSVVPTQSTSLFSTSSMIGSNYGSHR